MNHPSDDALLLLAYGELPEAQTAEVGSHLAACPNCRGHLERLERARVALDWAARPARRRGVRWAAVAIAAAAVLAVVVLGGPKAGPTTGRGWPPPRVWSATAGYIAGGLPVMVIDSLLTRLEQEKSYALP